MTPLALTFFLGFGVAVAGSFRVRAVASRYELVVAPRADRWHDRPTAIYGGMAIAGATVVALSIDVRSAVLERPAASAVTAAALLLFVVGLIDDARGIGPAGKFIDAPTGRGSSVTDASVRLNIRRDLPPDPDDRMVRCARETCVTGRRVAPSSSAHLSPTSA